MKATLSILLLFFLINTCWSKENMFAPPSIVIKKPEKKSFILHSNNPLQKFRLDAYKITGIVISTGFKRAVVVAPDRKTYFVRIGDYLGNRGEKIIDIKPDKIILTLGGKRIEMRVSKKKGEGGL